MKVKVLKNWSVHKKNDVVEILDKTLIDKGFSVGLFEEFKKPKNKE